MRTILRTIALSLLPPIITESLLLVEHRHVNPEVTGSMPHSGHFFSVQHKSCSCYYLYLHLGSSFYAASSFFPPKKVATCYLLSLIFFFSIDISKAFWTFLCQVLFVCSFNFIIFSSKPHNSVDSSKIIWFC